jgi:plastocyanin
VRVKPWQVFIFSLVPLALVFAGVIYGSVHGNDSIKEKFLPTPTAAATTPPGSTTPTSGSPSAGGVTLDLKAQDLKFDKRTLTAPPNTAVTVRLDNEDSGILHNFALYKKSDLKDKIFVGDLVNGRKTVEFKFTTPSAGSYFFRCDVHPDMNGTFTVR